MNKLIESLFARTCALLDEEETAPAPERRAIIIIREHAVAETRRAIEHALAAPADAVDRWFQLKAAVELDGVDSSLAALANHLFGEAIAPETLW